MYCISNDSAVCSRQFVVSWRRSAVWCSMLFQGVIVMSASYFSPKYVRVWQNIIRYDTCVWFRKYKIRTVWSSFGYSGCCWTTVYSRIVSDTHTHSRRLTDCQVDINAAVKHADCGCLSSLARRRRFWHATLGLRSAIRRHHPPQRVVLRQICCFGKRKMVFQILLDGAEPRDAGTTWLSSPVCRRGG